MRIVRKLGQFASPCLRLVVQGVVCLLITALAIACTAPLAATPDGDTAASDGHGDGQTQELALAEAIPGRLVHIDLGEIALDPLTGSSKPVAFSLPTGTLSAAITTSGPATVHLALLRWQSGGGPYLIVPSWLAGPFAPALCVDGCTFRQAERPEQQVALAPNAPLPVNLAGKNEIMVYGYTWSAAAKRLPSGTTVRVTVDAVLAPPVSKGRLSINICLTGAGGITAALAPNHARIAEAVAVVREIFAAIAVDIAVAFVDVKAAQFVRHDADDSEITELFKSGAHAPLGINVFLVQELNLETGGAPAAMSGLSGGIPGPIRQRGSAQAGVVVAIKLQPGQPDRLGVAIAHEIGHYLGLFHTEEPPSAQGPPLADQLTDTGTGDDGNMMYWSPQAHSKAITAQQATVIRQSPWIDPD